MLFVFFSSRRRHTRLTCDWSSDVCSSDLAGASASPTWARLPAPVQLLSQSARQGRRSEERRVGKECRSRWSPDHLKQKDREDTGGGFYTYLRARAGSDMRHDVQR